MPKTDPDTRVRLSAESIGVGPGSLAQGQEFVVREVVPKDSPGAHNSDEDAVVLEWTEDEALRAWSCGVTQYNVDFEEIV